MSTVLYNYNKSCYTYISKAKLNYLLWYIPRNSATRSRTMNNFRKNIIHWYSLLENSVPIRKVSRINDDAHLPEISEEMKDLFQKRRKSKNLKKRRKYEKKIRASNLLSKMSHLNILKFWVYFLCWSTEEFSTGSSTSISNYLAVCPLEIIL